MKLIAAFVDVAVTGHEGADFPAFFLYPLGKVAAFEPYGCFFSIWGDFLRYEEDPLFFHNRKLVCVF